MRVEMRATAGAHDEAAESGLPPLTAEQRAVVTATGSRVLVVGSAGSGRTAALLARTVARLPSPGGPGRVTFVARDGGTARAVRDALARACGGDASGAQVVTVLGLAHDVVQRHGRERRVLTRAEERRLVARMLRDEDPAAWPTLHGLLDRRAFADELVDALAALDEAALSDDDVLARADTAGAHACWAEVLAFRPRWQAALARGHATTRSALLADAGAVLARSGDDAREDRELVVDDADLLSPGEARVLERVARQGSTTLVAAVHPGRLDFPLVAELAARATRCLLGAPVTDRRPPELVVAHHPALEAEAVAAELLASREGGAAWRDMVILVRRPRDRAASIARALTRHGIPTRVPVDALAHEPVVRAVLDLLRWAAGDDDALDRLLVGPLAQLDAADVRRVRHEARRAGEPLVSRPELARLVAVRDLVRAVAPQHDPAALVLAVWEHGLVHLAGDDATPADDRALDALVALTDVLSGEDVGLGLDAAVAALEELSASPASRAAGRAGDRDGDDVVRIEALSSASGRQWHTVVVVGCVEGELPAPVAAPAVLDPQLVHGSVDGVPAPAERRRRALDEERRLFETAVTRATARTVLVAAPPPGVLVSRFADALTSRPARLPATAVDAPPRRDPTPGVVPVWPEGRLRLSATQLETYDDCPRRYAYEYALHLRREAGSAAALGTLVHAVLAEFLDPHRSGPRTRDELMRLAEAHWRDDLATYRPQVEELRRDYVAMLEAWWDAGPPPADGVVAVERRFEVEVGPHVVAGAIDVVERIAGDDGDALRIVDFKTGKSEPTPDEVADNLQLATYHLAARRDPELAAYGEVRELALVFLRSLAVLEQPIAGDHEARTEQRILATAERVLAEAFEPSIEAHCDRCDLHRICPLWPEGREVGV